MESNLENIWRFYKETAIAVFIPGKDAAKRDSLYANSVFLIANACSNAVLGFGFWVVAARLYPTEVVGLASAMWSAGGMLAFIAVLGLGQGLIRFLPMAREKAAPLINSSITIATAVAAVAALVFIAGIPLWSPALGFIRSDIRFGITFVIFVISGTLFNLFSDTYLALRRAEYTFIQGAAMGMLKVIFAVALAGTFGIFGMLASYTFASAAIVALGLFVFLVRLQPGYRPIPALPRKADEEMIRFSFTNYLAQGLGSLTGWILPVMVLDLAGSTTNAYFFMGWSFAALLFAVPTATANSMFAECSQSESDMAHNLRRSLKLIAMLAVPLAAALFLLGDKLLLAFGRQYSEQSTQLLWVLIPSIIPVTINSIYSTTAKVAKRMRVVLGMAAVSSIGTLGLSYFLLPRFGITGPGWAWLISQTALALVILPGFIRLFKQKRVAE
jgi:O-antigen/teichoic acid export membrane protein